VVISNDLHDRRELAAQPALERRPRAPDRRARLTALAATSVYAVVATLVIATPDLLVLSTAGAPRPDLLAHVVNGLVFVAVTSALLYAIVARMIGAAAERERRLCEALAESYETTLAGWSRALDLRDHETEGHSSRVTELAVGLATRMGVAGEDLEHIRRGAMLHDIGKIGVPDAILHKPGPLADEEWAVMRRHPEYAYDMLQPIEFLRPVLDIPYCHHERWDGSGYPRGLAGEEIPLAARIFAVVDVWDALINDRPYRAAWPHKQVVAYLRAHAGNLFDPAVVRAFLTMIENEREWRGRDAQKRRRVA
jgi:putative nucleotidyltransferase with HDIG domain